MDKFQASVQYGDWCGTAAADDVGKNDFRKYLRDQSILPDDEFLIGFELYFGEPSPVSQRYVAIAAFSVSAPSYDGAVSDAVKRDPVEVYRREVKLDLQEFFDLFKRFSLILTHRGLDLEGREYVIMEG